MLKIQEIREIIKLIDQSSIEKFTFESEGTKIKLEKAGVQQVTVAPQVQKTEYAPIQQPVVEQPAAAPVAAPQSESQEQQPAAAPVEKVQEDASLHKITSPMVGTFYKASSPDAPPYAQKGDQVKPDTVVCIVEAMKLFNEIEAEVSGEIVEVLVEDGQLVEYGQPLFLVKEN
ncbi:acetyl-CoA carboxylase, biotin carboxyl carrier protein [Sporosarcina sp. NCCP-2222]|uniref:acetyl-CoA carboxylase biotin carboxyl carrier protein n=1 Tax=Sporosarcina sp. NCCP-2222 TaxID=2935073 RepID=UPI002087107A|nr:acetyl-CoA carboxylase biotin carboxyl carrier protein [Sporosarcina sp. NCCP-2222]GKV54193.1 acetyl-CoA carboxylase, biotin carboxyl carrier protein [Sporosarcina sp. NCCP-2222]